MATAHPNIMMTIDQIYECMDRGEFGKGLELCSRPEVIRLTIGQALMSYCYAGNRNFTKALEVGRRLSHMLMLKGTGPDESTLNVLGCALKACKADADFVHIMEFSFKANNYMYSEQMIVDLFFAYARQGDPKKMHQIAQKMYKLPFAQMEGKKYFLTWSVTCMLLQDDLPPAMLTLAQKLLVKAQQEVHGNKQPGSEELTMCLFIQMRQQDYAGALKTLADLTSRPVPPRVNDDRQFQEQAAMGVPAFPLHKSMLKIDILVRLGRLMDVVEEARDVIIEQYPDQWNVHRIIIDCLIRMSRTSFQSETSETSAITATDGASPCNAAGDESRPYFQFPATDFDILNIPVGLVDCTGVTAASVASLIPAHFSYLRTLQAKHPKLRGPFLAEMRLLLSVSAEVKSNHNAAIAALPTHLEAIVSEVFDCSESATSTMSTTVLALVALYMDRFSDKHICFADVKPIVDASCGLAAAGSRSQTQEMRLLQHWAVNRRSATVEKLLMLELQGRAAGPDSFSQLTIKDAAVTAVAAAPVIESAGTADCTAELNDQSGAAADESEDEGDQKDGDAAIAGAAIVTKKKKKKKKSGKKKTNTGGAAAATTTATANPFAHLRTTADAMALEEKRDKPLVLLMSAFSNYDRLVSFCTHLLRTHSSETCEVPELGSTIRRRLQLYEMYLHNSTGAMPTAVTESTAPGVTSGSSTATSLAPDADLPLQAAINESGKRAKQQMEEARVIQRGDDFLLENAAAHRVQLCSLKAQQAAAAAAAVAGSSSCSSNSSSGRSRSSSAALQRAVVATAVDWAAGLLIGIDESPGNYALKVALLEPLRILGVAESALVTYNGLGVKQVQLDSMMYVMTPLLTEMALWEEVRKQYKQLFTMHTVAKKETLEMMGRCFKHANYMKALELKAFVGRLEKSTQLALAQAEYPLLLLAAPTATTVSDTIDYLQKALLMLPEDVSSSDADDKSSKVLLPEAQAHLSADQVAGLVSNMDYELLTLTDQTPAQAKALAAGRDAHLRLRLRIAQSASRTLLCVLTGQASRARSFLIELQAAVEDQLANPSSVGITLGSPSVSEYHPWNQKLMTVTNSAADDCGGSSSGAFERTLWDCILAFFAAAIDCSETATLASGSAVAAVVQTAVDEMRRFLLGGENVSVIPLSLSSNQGQQVALAPMSADWIRATGSFFRTLGCWTSVVLKKMTTANGAASNRTLVVAVDALCQLFTDLGAILATEPSEQQRGDAEATKVYLDTCRDELPAAAVLYGVEAESDNLQLDGARMRVAQQMSSSYALSCSRLAAVAAGRVADLRGAAVS